MIFQGAAVGPRLGWRWEAQELCRPRPELQSALHPPRIFVFSPGMMKICIFAGTTVGGIAGGMLAGALGMDWISLGNFFLSGLGSVVGVFVGWKIARKLDE
jgi:hypothetical protein